MKNIIYFVLLLCLGIHLYEKIDFYENHEGKHLFLELEVYHGRAKSLNRYQIVYTKLGELEDGRYEGEFEILEKTPYYYDLKICSLQKKEENFCQLYLKRCVEHLGEGRDPSFRHFLEAILLGRAWTLFREERKLFQYVGLSHVLAISGLHVGLLFFFLERVLFFLQIPKQARNWAKLGMSTFYLFGVFLSPSFLRAYIMGVFYLFHQLLGEKISRGKMLFFSVWILLMLHPTELLSPSFLLSYTAILTIFYVFPLFKMYFEDLPSYVSYIFYAVSIPCTGLPLTLYFFGSMACLSYFVNLILLPFAGFLILLSFFSLLLEVFHLGFLTVSLLEFCYHGFYEILEYLGKIPYVTIYFEDRISGETVVILYSILFLIVRVLYKNHKNPYRF